MDNIDESTESNRTVDHGPSAIELVRVIDRTIHVSPTDRKKEVDYHVRNQSDKELNFIFLHLRRFARNLQIYDEDGIQLSYYPNDEVKTMVKKAKKDNPKRHAAIKEQFDRWKYMVYIQLPPERPLGPGEMRVIRLTFEEPTVVEFDGVSDPSLLSGWCSQWEKKFFDIPSFFADVKRYCDDPHDVFVNVIGPSGYTTEGTTEYENGKPEKVYENGLSGDARSLSIRLPPSDYTCGLQYELTPRSRTFMLSLAVYWVIATILGTISFLFLASIPLINHLPGLFPLSELIINIGTTTAVGFLTVTTGLIFALNTDWADRYKVMSIVPLLLHSMSWIMWTII